VWTSTFLQSCLPRDGGGSRVNAVQHVAHPAATHVVHIVGWPSMDGWRERSGPVVSQRLDVREDAIDTVTIPQVTGGPLCYTKNTAKKTCLAYVYTLLASESCPFHVDTHEFNKSKRNRTTWRRVLTLYLCIFSRYTSCVGTCLHWQEGSILSSSRKRN
jgi:hypothetical protein